MTDRDLFAEGRDSAYYGQWDTDPHDPPPTDHDVLGAVEYDEALTVGEIAARVCGVAAWRHRTNVRNRLYALADRGLVISDENRPMRFIRPDLPEQTAQDGP